MLYSPSLLSPFSCRPDHKVPRNFYILQDSIQKQKYCRTLIDNKNHSSVILDPLNLNEGDTFNLLNGLNFDEGKWAVIMSTGKYYDDSLGSRPSGIYLLDDQQKIASNLFLFDVVYQHGDCCTPDAHISFYKNDSLVFSTGFTHKNIHGIKNGYVTFQNGVYGGTPPVDEKAIEKMLRHFIKCTDF